MKIKSIVFAVASTLSMTALADNASVDSAEIQKAIQLLENKGYKIDSPNEAKKSPPPGVQLKNYQLGKLDAFVSGSYGRSRYKADYSADEFLNNNKVTDDSYNLRGSFAYQDPSNLGFQFDGLYSQNQIKYAKVSTVDLAGHAFYRNEKFLLGMFGQYKNPKLHFKDGDGSADGFLKNGILNTAFAKEQVFFGGEAQGYFGDLTLTGQLARQHFINKGQDGSVDSIYSKGVVATAKADYFINDNWKLTSGYSHNKVDFSADAKYKIHKFSVGTEYQLTNYPVSFFGDFTRNKLNFDVNYGDVEGLYAPSQRNQTLMVGLKYNFGGNSLKSRDRTGASLDPITTNGILDFIGQAFSQTNLAP